MAPGWKFITDLGDVAVTVPLALLMLGFLLVARRPRLALGWALAIVGCAAAIGAFKLALDACGDPLGAAGLASPSGHVAMSTAVYGGFAAIVAPSLPRIARLPAIAAIAALIAAIAASRVILGFHSTVEVAVGLAVGAAALAGIVWLALRQSREALPVLWLIGGAVLLALLFHGHRWPAERAIRHAARWFEIVRSWCG